MDEFNKIVAEESDCVVYIKADVGAGIKLAFGFLAVISAPIILLLIYLFFYAFF